MNRANPFWENTPQKGKGVETLNNTVVAHVKLSLKYWVPFQLATLKKYHIFPEQVHRL